VETFVERWMKAGKRDINVKLTLIYKKTKGGKIIDSDDEADSNPMVKKV
jgi:hypothetical protein